MLRFHPSFFIGLSFAVLLLPLRWILGWASAVFVHESFHYFALKICRANACNIEIGLTGAVMETQMLSAKQEVFCALSGPLGSAILTLTGRWFPCTAICAAVHMVFNLLPIYPFDGGRALVGSLRALGFDKHIGLINNILKGILLFGLLILSGLAATNQIGILPLVITVCIFLKAYPIKRPCKQSQQIVQ